jgi:eukaryotic-like serine/threonine-protein kinase
MTSMKRFLNISKYLLGYGLITTILFVFGLVIFENILLPSYIGFDNEHYLPDLRGEYSSVAEVSLKNTGFKIEIHHKNYSDEHSPGTIVSMSPRPFTKVKEGRTIKLTVAGHRVDFEMPDFVSKSYRNVELALRSFDLKIDTIMYEFNDYYEEGIVTFQSPKSKHLIRTGTAVTLMVSRGTTPNQFRVPDLINMSLAKAKIMIDNSGLRLGEIEYIVNSNWLPNTVIDQSHPASMKLSIPVRIDLVVSIEKDEK